MAGPASEDARALLVRLAQAPRPAGSDAEGRARRLCADRLAALGFAVGEEAFEYSAGPGRWGTPVGGLVSMLVVATAAHLGARGRALEALLLLAGSAAALLLVGAWTARRLVLDLPLARRRGVNLVATRGEPAVWLMAHLDSKSQPVPIGLRAAGVVVSALAWLAALAASAGQLGGAAVGPWWPWLAAAGVVGGLPVALTTVGDHSAGAVDNASGVAAVLDAAARLPAEMPAGVVLTSAEELGLAGARAWARTRAPAVALNCDGVDDRGRIVAMYSGRRPDRLLEVMRRAAAASATPFGARRLVPGILTDGVALADAGWAVVTVSRGTLATLARIHSRRDDLARLRGDGLDEAGALLAATAASLVPYGGRVDAPPAARPAP